MKCFGSVAAVWTIVLLLGIAGGCAPSARQPRATAAQPADADPLGPTVGAMAEVFASEAIPVSGYALVGGLNGTGSSECPASVRSYLEKYILQQLSGSSVNVNELIASKDTAVVTVEGTIPPAASKNQRFDVRVTALPGTQTISLADGWLYGADLYDSRRLGVGLKALATAEGPVYTDSIASAQADTRTGYVLGGGAVREDYRINLALRRPDYRAASQIRNRMNERFGSETAWALTPGNIELRVPPKYESRKDRFIRLVRATYLTETNELTEKRVMSFVQKLAASQEKEAGEIALETIGNACLPKLAALVNSSDEETRLRAGRCMANLGDARGRESLWKIVSDPPSKLRVEALEAIVGALSPGAPGETASMLRSLLRGEDFELRLAACQNLIKLNDVTVSRKLIADSFYLDLVSGTGKPAIYVSRSTQPQVILFSAPIYCRSNLFVQSADGAITINAPAGQQYATIIRRHPRRSDVIVQLRSSLELDDIIQTLCKEPVAKPAQGGPGLGVSYSALVGLLKQMIDADAVEAEFHVGAEPKPGPAIKK